MKLCLNRIRLPLHEFALEVDVTLTNQVTAICGPSGSGKTSLLDLVAGIRRPQSALIQLEDQVLTDTSTGIDVPARHRHIGYVPQDLALFPHLSVLQNLLYGRKSKDELDVNGPFGYDHVTKLLEIQSLADRRIGQLSGGEKQRVALGRALLSSPKLLLLDEPLASLDRALKAKILPYLIAIRDEFHLPMLYVTHDSEEIQPLCQCVMSIRRGRVTQS